MVPDQYLIKRERARGDVLLCTPVLSALKQKHPGAVFDFRTEYPQVLEGNPNVRRAGPIFDVRQYRHIISLEVAYEKMPCTHLIDAFKSGAELSMGEALPVKRKLEMYPKASHFAAVSNMLSGLTNYIVIAPGPGAWPGRNWNELRWRILCGQLLRTSPVVLVGTGREYQLPNTYDLRGQTSYLDLAAVIKNARMFVGIDSFPAHVAGAMETPRVVLFGITHARYILCDSPHTFPVESDPSHRFSGARHYVERISSVRLGNPPRNPMDSIQVYHVQSAVQKALNVQR